jgi:salicylate hydroxylase
MRECGGEWMFTTYEALRLLYIEAARANGAVLRFGTKVEAVDQDGALLQLADGEVFSADLIVGADGAKSLVRNILFEGNEDTQSTGLVSFK